MFSVFKTIQGKLGFTFIVLIIIQLIVSISHVYFSGQVRNMLIKANKSTFSFNEKSKLLSSTAQEMSSIYQVLATGHAHDVFGELEKLKNNEVKLKEISQSLEKYGFSQQIAHVLNSFEAIKETGSKMVLAFVKKNKEEGNKQRIKMLSALKIWDEAILRLNSAVEQKGESHTAQIFTVLEKGVNVTWFSLIICFLIAVLAGVWVTRNLRNTIARCVKSLKISSKNLDTVSINLDEQADNLLERSKDQSNKLRTTSAAAVEINSTVKLTADRVKSAADVAKDTFVTAKHGQEVIESLRDSMEIAKKSSNQLSNQVIQSNEKIEGIIKLIDDLGSKTAMINKIVFQTKLLSFNASVEAARAGENGKGFAVVANEIGQLAQSSGVTANEIEMGLNLTTDHIRVLIKESTSSLSESTVDSDKAIKSSQIELEKFSKIFSTILENSDTTTKVIQELSRAAQEQAVGVSEIQDSITQIDSIAAYNKNIAESMTLIIDDLKSTIDKTELAVNLVEAVVVSK